MIGEASAAGRSQWRLRLLLAVAGLGGLLYGIDVGIISAALLYLGKTISLSVAQTSLLVAAVLGGSMVSSVFAGFLADLAGRRRMMILSGLLFVLSVLLIVSSAGFVPLLTGRILQGLSGGVIAVIVPLYLAEVLPAETRGRGSATFQFMLTAGIVAASVVGFLYSRSAESAIAAANSDAAKILRAEGHAWRGMFLTVIYPGLLFLAGTLFLPESPRWLFRKGREAQAKEVLRQTLEFSEAEREFLEMQRIRSAGSSSVSSSGGSLLQKRYVVPFVLACLVLTFNQTTGINSVLGYLVIILRDAGMSAVRATQGDVAVKLLNCAMTLVAIYLVDRRGRKFLLTIGTAGIVAALAAAGMGFLSFESRRVDVTNEVRYSLHASGPQSLKERLPTESTLTVLYDTGGGTKVARGEIAASAAGRLPAALEQAPGGVSIDRAYILPAPSAGMSWLIGGCMALFIASFSVGPGVVVWLALSELMPTRIRSAGMGIALLLNQGASTGVAALFLPVVSRYGYHTMFFFWTVCSVFYFGITVLFLPETKGKTLEEIEEGFAA